MPPGDTYFSCKTKIGIGYCPTRGCTASPHFKLVYLFKVGAGAGILKLRRPHPRKYNPVTKSVFSPTHHLEATPNATNIV